MSEQPRREFAIRDDQPQWCEFSIKGSGGALLTWHLVTREGNGFRSSCGRLLLAKPERCIEKDYPDTIRGICRSCARISGRWRSV